MTKPTGLRALFELFRLCRLRKHVQDAKRIEGLIWDSSCISRMGMDQAKNVEDADDETTYDSNGDYVSDADEHCQGDLNVFCKQSYVDADNKEEDAAMKERIEIGDMVKEKVNMPSNCFNSEVASIGMDKQIRKSKGVKRRK